MLYRTSFLMSSGVRKFYPGFISPPSLSTPWGTGYPECSTRGDAADTTAVWHKRCSPVQVRTLCSQTRYKYRTRAWYWLLLSLTLASQNGKFRWSRSAWTPGTTGWMAAGKISSTSWSVRVTAASPFLRPPEPWPGFLKAAARFSLRWDVRRDESVRFSSFRANQIIKLLFLLNTFTPVNWNFLSICSCLLTNQKIPKHV